MADSLFDPQRLARRFQALRAAGRGGLVTFTMAGDPDATTALELLRGLPAAGADVVELGMPFSDPMADGPAIQAAGQRALKAGMTLAGVLDIVRAFRAGDSDTPLILMGYCNPILRYGVAAFFAAAAEAGADGFIIVDAPPEEAERLQQHTALPLIRLVTPTSTAARLETILSGAAGFLYYVAVAGITGTRSASTDSIAQAVATVRRSSDLPIAVGFGIRTPEAAAAVAAHADAAVVGSAIVEKIAAALTPEGAPHATLVPDALAFVAELAQAVHDAPRHRP